MMNAEQAIAATGRPGKIEITSKKAADRIVTIVRDTGAGISEEALSRIFEPFYTTKGSRQRHGPRPRHRLRHRPGARRDRFS